MDREKITNKDKFNKMTAKIETHRTRLDKDSEQLLRQTNEINDINI